jgi:hypothetical protein
MTVQQAVCDRDKAIAVTDRLLNDSFDFQYKEFFDLESTKHQII